MCAGVLLDFPLPLAMYKKLVGQSLTLRDLADFDPTLGRSLRQLLNYDGALTLLDPAGCGAPHIPAHPGQRVPSAVIALPATARAPIACQGIGLQIVRPLQVMSSLFDLDVHIHRKTKT